MAERMTKEELAEIRRLSDACMVHLAHGGDVHPAVVDRDALLDELDAVTRERDEATADLRVCRDELGRTLADWHAAQQRIAELTAELAMSERTHLELTMRLAGAEQRGFDRCALKAADICAEFRSHVPNVPGKEKAQQALSIVEDMIRQLAKPPEQQREVYAVAECGPEGGGAPQYPEQPLQRDQNLAEALGAVEDHAVPRT